VRHLTGRVDTGIRTAGHGQPDRATGTEQALKLGQKHTRDRTATGLRRPARELGAVVAHVETQTYPRRVDRDRRIGPGTLRLESVGPGRLA
jgi:hypothetical protein